MADHGTAGSNKWNPAGFFCLTTDLGAPGVLKKIAGGDMKAEVAEQQVGGDIAKFYALSTVSYEPFSGTLAFGQSKGLWGAIQSALDLKHTRFNGSVMAMTADQKVVGVREFFNAALTEVKWPTFDAKSKDLTSIDFKITPTSVKYLDGTGSAEKAILNNEYKDSLCCNFQCDFPGLESKNIHKLEMGAVTIKLEKSYSGKQKLADLVVTSVEIGEIKAHIGTQDLKVWADWVNEHVFVGNTGAAKAITGTCEALHPNMKDVLATWTYEGLIPVGLKVGDLEANKAGVSDFVVTMKCERLKFQPSKIG